MAVRISKRAKTTSESTPSNGQGSSMSIRASKKMKVATDLPQNAGDIHKEFTQWAIARGVEIKGVKAQKLPGRGLGLMTTKKIARDQRILFVPEKAMFKPDTELLKSASLASASPQAQLAISAMNQCLPAPSIPPLSIWQKTWPTNQDFENTIPLCWPDDLRRHLPASIDQPLDRQLKDYTSDWDTCSAYCTSCDWTEEQFRYYWLIVNSRSFHWKPTTTAASKRQPTQLGQMVLCPFIDYMNHTSTGTSVNVYQRKNGYEVVADRHYEPGEEILSTYGPHSNDKLLTHYGFLLPSPNPNHTNIDDEIRLDAILLPLIPTPIQAQLRDTGFLGNYALLPREGSWEMCFKTQVAVRAVLCSCNEWEYYVSNGEDLGQDFDDAVKVWVGEALERYREEADGKIVELEEMVQMGETEQKRSAIGIMTARWTQIRNAIDGFMR